MRWDILEARCVRKLLKEPQLQGQHKTGKERMDRSDTSKEISMTLYD